MIFSLVVLLLLIIFLAFFIGKNLTNLCTFWIFKTFTDLPVAILALIAFGAGVVVSILVFLVAKLKKSATEDKIAEAKEKVKKQQDKTEKELKKLGKKNRKTDKNQQTESTKESTDNTIVQDEKKDE